MTRYQNNIIVVLASAAWLAGCAAGSTSDQDLALDSGDDRGLQFPDGGGREGGAPTETGAPDGPPASDAVVADGSTQDGPSPDANIFTGKIIVSAPAGGESWGAGSAHTISWTSTGVSGLVNLELWKGGGMQSGIAMDQPSSGAYSWQIPGATPPAGDYKVRVVSKTSSAWGSSVGPFSIVNWTYQMPVSINATMVSSSLNNTQVLLTLDPPSFAYAHARPGGADLRFSSAASAGSFDLPFWIESWNPSGPSKIWIRVPSIPAGGNKTIYMFYGNTSAPPASNLGQTFPSRYISAGTINWGGTHNHDWFELKSGHTLNIATNQKLTINARKIIISGVINGSGRGYAGGVGAVTGGGPGGGKPSGNSGAGGGSYGGTGGMGGYDSGDTPGSGGNPYGSSSASTVELGSGGGGAGALSKTNGGNGGGGVFLSGTDVKISGSIQVNGLGGQPGGQCSGGGSGGGILVKGVELSMSGSLQARGGPGGTGTNNGNDGGGGGGGGRIKVIYQSKKTGASGKSTTGGSGGQYGGVSHGKPGTSGSSYTGKKTWHPIVTPGAEKTL